ncbi:MAG: hypothetical protein WAV47_13425, partial [Blastocatellia bacterium]
PFVEDSIIERIDGSGFNRDADGRLILFDNQVQIIDDKLIYRQDPQSGVFVAFANNPWPQPTANDKGNFKFSDEERFPLHEIERGPDGKPVLDKDGLQMWKPRDLHLGMTTVFEAAVAAKNAAEFWSGRNVDWGKVHAGILPINSHAFIDFNAFYSPSADGLFFGVVPHRLPGRTEIKMFEMGTSWEVAAHESGHAVQAAIKPNRNFLDIGYRTWGESFGDQIEMWASLRDRRRARALLDATNGDLNQSNALTRLGEVLGSLTGEDACLRDAFHDKRVSNTTPEPHDRSEVLTGAAYKFFLLVYVGLRGDHHMGAEGALETAGDIMGTFLLRSADYTPENNMTLEDVSKAYLKVDKEFFGSSYRSLLVDEFTRRELFNAHSLNDWLAHEAAMPNIRLPRRISEKAVDDMLQASLDKLGIGPAFGLKLQSITGETGFGQTIVRVQLTEGRDSDAVPLDNHGILVFRTDGTLADYHGPLASDDGSQMRLQAQVEARSLVDRAKQLTLDHRGAGLSIARRPDGEMTVEARVMRSKGFYCWVDVFTLENAQGERREIITPHVPRKIGGFQPSGVQILTANDLVER